MEIQLDYKSPAQMGAERWGSSIADSSLVLRELHQRSLRSVLMALGDRPVADPDASPNLQNAVMAATGLDRPIQVEKTVTIQNKSAAELYHFWHNFENLPTFMQHLKSVTVASDTRSHWIANAPLGSSVQWDAEIVIDRPEQLIAWVSAAGADVDNCGFVRFQSPSSGRGIEVKVVMEYNLLGGAITAAIAKLFGEHPEQQIGDDLRRFKMLMETGEIATTEGQSCGRRS
jgi:uncharacterized membrane protein